MCTYYIHTCINRSFAKKREKITIRLTFVLVEHKKRNHDACGRICWSDLNATGEFHLYKNAHVT